MSATTTRRYTVKDSSSLTWQIERYSSYSGLCISPSFKMNKLNHTLQLYLYPNQSVGYIENNVFIYLLIQPINVKYLQLSFHLSIINADGKKCHTKGQ